MRAAEAQRRRVHFFCPGCDAVHGIYHSGPPQGWTWNGKLDFPTFSPSLLMRRWLGNGLLRDHVDFTETEEVCHSFVTDGRIQFLGDSTHALAGQTVDIPEWPYD